PRASLEDLDRGLARTHPAARAHPAREPPVLPDQPWREPGREGPGREIPHAPRASEDRRSRPPGQPRPARAARPPPGPPPGDGGRGRGAAPPPSPAPPGTAAPGGGERR